jgi:hypothetical protein
VMIGTLIANSRGPLPLGGCMWRQLIYQSLRCIS